jgi:dienelactone hydrolase
MRSPCWCSGAAVLLLAGCGSKDAAPPDSFAYDTSRALHVQDAGVALSGPKVAVHVLTFEAARHVNAFLVVPRRAGRHPAVLFLHGSGGTREDLLLPAIELANRGAVTMTISQPNDAQSFRPLVVDARRALDVLEQRTDVDPDELGVVGFSLGGQTAAILAGDERRLKTVGILAGRGGPIPVYWLRRARAELFLQAGRNDTQVGRPALERLIDAAPGERRVRWYDAGHGLSRRAFADQLDWQAERLGLR